jgi:DNA invertase Pin-like site-specific DNA recombinase
MTKVFAYLRVSGATQIDGGGFERQADAIKVFCDAKGYIIARTFKEQQSGADEYLDRKVMADMVDTCSQHGHGICTIVVENPTRIARDIMIQELFLRDCLRKKIQVFTAESGEELTNPTNDPTRTLIRQILGALSQWEKATITKRLQAGRRRVARETGKPCGAPPKFNTDEQRSISLEFIKEHREKQNLSWAEIARLAQQQKWPCQKYGAVWQRGTVKYLYEKYCQNKRP